METKSVVSFQDVEFFRVHKKQNALEILNKFKESEVLAEPVSRIIACVEKEFKKKNESEKTRKTLRCFEKEIKYRMRFYGYEKILKETIGKNVFLQAEECYRWIEEKEKKPEEILVKFYCEQSVDKLFNPKELFSEIALKARAFFQNFKEQELDLSGDQITKIPNELCELHTLTKLDLSRNRFRIPSELPNLKSLRILSLQRCKLVEVPKEMGNLESLEDLDLRENYLEKIPKEIGNLKHLEFLNLGDNFLTEIPEEFGNLQSLKVINLNKNTIGKIPLEMEKLSTSLKYLFLSSNSEIPEKLKNITVLTDHPELMNPNSIDMNYFNKMFFS